MKKLMLGLILLTSQAKAEWHGFSLPDYSNPLSLIHPVGGRGFINGQWLTGYGKDLLFYQIPGSINGHPLPRLYLSANHLFNAAELLQTPSKTTGIFGPAIGTEIGGLASKFQAAINFGLNFIHDTGGPIINAPQWIINDLDKWISIEAGGGYRLFGSMPDVKPWEAWVGGRVTVYFDVFAHH